MSGSVEEDAQRSEPASPLAKTREAPHSKRETNGVGRVNAYIGRPSVGSIGDKCCGICPTGEREESCPEGDAQRESAEALGETHVEGPEASSTGAPVIRVSRGGLTYSDLRRLLRDRHRWPKPSGSLDAMDNVHRFGVGK